MSFSQVGGHANTIRSTEDGSLLMKPVTTLEHEFYLIIAQARAMDTTGGLEGGGTGIEGGIGDGKAAGDALDERTLRALKNLKRLSRFVAEFYGTLAETSIDAEELKVDADAGQGGHSTTMSQDATNVVVDTTDRHPVVNTPSQQYLVLSNLLYSFTKPNVLDLKLGTVFYDKRDLGCSEEKKARMIKAARETTSGESGIRLTGFQVHPQPSSSLNTETAVHRLAPLLTLKSYGKSLKKEQLPEGIRRAFPVLGELVPVYVSGIESSASSASTSGTFTPFEAFIPSTASGSLDVMFPTPASRRPAVEPRTDLGLPAIVLLPILRSIHTSVLHLHSILKEVEIRIVGGSLLVVWEGDEQRARDGVQWMEEKEARIKERERTRSETDEDGNDDEYMDSDDDEEDTSSEEDEGSASPNESNSDQNPERTTRRRKPSAPYTLCLIDFAHTRFVPGQGPDVGVLLGLVTFAKLVEGRIREVKEAVKQ